MPTPYPTVAAVYVSGPWPASHKKNTGSPGDLELVLLGVDNPTLVIRDTKPCGSMAGKQ
jgi:hypothetical protein